MVPADSSLGTVQSGLGRLCYALRRNCSRYGVGFDAANRERRAPTSYSDKCGQCILNRPGIPGAASGSYLVTVTGDEDAPFVLTADATAGTGSASRLIVLGTLVGGARRFLLDCTPTTVAVLAVTAAELHDGPSVPVALGARPNPSDASFGLDFIVPRPGHVDLQIIDIQGRRVATLLNGVRPAGPVSTLWTGRSDDGSRVPAGVYLARLVVNGDTAVKRLVVLK